MITPKFALIKRADMPSGWRVADIENRGMILFDNSDEEKSVIKSLLENGAEIFESEEEFLAKFPPFTKEERLSQGMKYWVNIPKEKWPKDVRDFFEGNEDS